MNAVQGTCPACGGKHLFLGEGGHVTCSLIGCPNPCAADDLLANHRTCHPNCEDQMTCMGPATTSARTEAAGNAMGYAREAALHEDDRRAATAAMFEIATNPEAPSVGPRIRRLEDDRDLAVKLRDIAITMANMWAAVAAVQEQS